MPKLPPPLRIGVLTLHRSINYGSYWQARCLAEGLRGMGHEVRILDHHCPRVRRAEWRCALNPLLPAKLTRDERRPYAAKARHFFAAHAALPLSPAFPLSGAAGAGPHDVVVVGSDEVWNSLHPWYGRQPIFYGSGLTADRLISYAASFGTHGCQMGLEHPWADLLARFHALSVRDANSKRLIGAALSREATLVLDPCLQFPPCASPAVEEGRYALVYGHGFPEWFGRMLRNWAGDRGLRLLSVGYGNGFADEQRIAAGPEDFARLMAGAEAVATNFFHGCVFALVNEKPFACTASWYRYNKLAGLLEAAGCEERMLRAEATPAALSSLLETPPGPAVAMRLAELRSASSGFLAHALA